MGGHRQSVANDPERTLLPSIAALQKPPDINSLVR
jgi:hypothetical protein